MLRFLVGIILLTSTSGVMTQNSIESALNFRVGPPAPIPCLGADLSVRHVNDDAAMGGRLLTEYAFKNNSSRACTLKGYPRFELLTKSGQLLPEGRALKSRELPGDEGASDPHSITIEAGKEAIFLVYTNNGGAGHVGKPCPMSRKVSIVAPGTTRKFFLKDEIRSCQAVKVSAVRVSSPNQVDQKKRESAEPSNDFRPGNFWFGSAQRGRGPLVLPSCRIRNAFGGALRKSL